MQIDAAGARLETTAECVVQSAPVKAPGKRALLVGQTRRLIVYFSFITDIYWTTRITKALGYRRNVSCCCTLSNEIEGRINVNLAPGYPSEYLLFRQDPSASSTALLAKFCNHSSAHTVRRERKFTEPPPPKHTQLYHCCANICSFLSDPLQ